MGRSLPQPMAHSHGIVYFVYINYYLETGNVYAGCCVLVKELFIKLCRAIVVIQCHDRFHMSTNLTLYLSEYIFKLTKDGYNFKTKFN